MQRAKLSMLKRVMKSHVPVFSRYAARLALGAFLAAGTAAMGYEIDGSGSPYGNISKTETINIHTQNYPSSTFEEVKTKATSSHHSELTGYDINIQSGNNTFNGEVQSSKKGNVNISGGVNTFNSTLSGASTDRDKSRLTITGGTFILGQDGEIGSFNDKIYIGTDSEGSKVTLQGFDYSKIASDASSCRNTIVKGDIVLDDMNMDKEFLTTGKVYLQQGSILTGKQIQGSDIYLADANVTASTKVIACDKNGELGIVEINGTDIQTGKTLTTRADQTNVYTGFDGSLFAEKGNIKIETTGDNLFGGNVQTKKGDVSILSGTNTFNGVVRAGNHDCYTPHLYIQQGVNTFNNDLCSDNGQIVISGGDNKYSGDHNALADEVIFTNNSTVRGTLNIGSTENHPDVTLGGTINFVADDSTGTLEIGQINAQNAEYITVVTSGSDKAEVNVDISTVNRSELGTYDLILGNGADTLTGLEGQLLYSSLLYQIQTGNNADDSIYQLRVNKASTDDLIGQIGGNSGSVHDLIGDDLFDVPTLDQAAANVRAIAGETFASAGSAQINRMNYLNRMMTDKMMGYSPCGMEDPHACCRCGTAAEKYARNVWVSGYGLSSDVTLKEGYGAYDYTVGGILLGVDHTEGETLYGAFYGYGQTTVGSENTSLQSKDHTFGAYAKWNSFIGGGYSLALTDFSFSSYNGRRTFSSLSFDADYDGWQAGLLLEKGWKYQNVYGNYVNPFIDLQYLSYYSDAFDDSFLQFSSLQINSLRTILGVRLWDNICLDNGQRWGIGGVAAWHHELLDTDGLFIANLDGASAPILGNGGGRDWVETSIGVSTDLTSRISLSGNYYLYFNKYTTMNAGMGTVTYRF